MTSKAPTLSIYVDEYGDRGFSDESSDWFVVTAVVIPNESLQYMRAVIGGLAHVVNTNRGLHWVEHFKAKHSARRHLASQLCASIPGALVVYALAHKKTLRGGYTIRSDQAHFYHRVTQLALERAAFACRDWEGGPRIGKVYLSQIKGVTPDETAKWYGEFRAGKFTNAPVDNLCPQARVATPDSLEGLQLADLYQGMFQNCLVSGDEDEEVTSRLLRCRHQLRRSATGNVMGYGLKVYGADGSLWTTSWWKKLVSPLEEAPRAPYSLLREGVRLPGPGLSQQPPPAGSRL